MEEKMLRIGFVGAGTIHFGHPGLPWDHASRLEKLGTIQVVGIADPDLNKAQEQLEKRKKNKEFGFIYKECKIFADADQLLREELDAVFIGVPPLYRGSEEYDLELKCLKAGVNVFVEKPLSVVEPEQFKSYSEKIIQVCQAKNVILSVGYMFRYHAAVLKMKEIMKKHGGKMMAFNARYYFAYTMGQNKYWWNTKISGGPIVEQATHFLDLARFLGGDIKEDSIHTICLKDDDQDGAGKLKHLPDNVEDDIASKDRIPRVTVSHWRYCEGGVGTLMHTVALPGTRYEANIDVQLDGLKLSLIDPYSVDEGCILKVRDMDNLNKDVVYNFGDTDCYKEELETFLKAVRTTDQSIIQSSYADATKTYNLSWAIRKTGS